MNHSDKMSAWCRCRPWDLHNIMRVAFGLMASFMMLQIVNAAESDGADTLRVGVQGASPPFSFVKHDGSRGGFDVDIATALCRVLEKRCQWVESDFASLIPGLRENRFDVVVASLSITEKRRKWVDFTNKYYKSPARFVAHRDSNIEFSTEGLQGKYGGVKRGTTFDRYLTDNFAGVVQIRRYSTQDDALVDLVLERLDFILGDHIVLTENFLKLAVGQAYQLVGPVVDDPMWFGEGIGIAVRKGNRLLVDALNRALDQIRTDGTYDAIRSRYFDYNISETTQDGPAADADLSTSSFCGTYANN